MKDLNRLKVALVERKKIGKWLDKLSVKTLLQVQNGALTPRIHRLIKIAELLDVDSRELINKSI